MSRITTEDTEEHGGERVQRILWKHRSDLRGLCGVFFFFVLAGCVSGLKQPAPELHSYVLDYTSPAMEGRPVPVTLRVAQFAVAAAYDRELIVYRADAYSIATYFYHRWSAPPGAMIADSLARDFAASGLYRVVQQAPSVLPTDYQIDGQVESIEEHTTGRNCSASLRMRLVVIRTRAGTDNPVLVRKIYGGEEPTPCNDPPALVAAMSRVLAQISAQLQADAHEAIARDSGA